MNAVVKKLTLLTFVAFFALGLTASAHAIGDFNPEDPSDFLCTENDSTYTVESGNNYSLCAIDETCVVDAAGEFTGEKTSTEACTDFTRTIGCFDLNTKILMADGSEKTVHQLKVGELVWNPIRKAPMAIAKMAGGPEKPAMREIGFDGASVKVTADHPMIVFSMTANASLSTVNPESKDLSVKRADEVSLNDFILGADGEYHRVNVLRMLPVKEGQFVVNFALETNSTDPADHAVVADGIVTGDLKAQIELKKDGSI